MRAARTYCSSGCALPSSSSAANQPHRPPSRGGSRHVNAFVTVDAKRQAVASVSLAAFT